jgi:hypothetical protein
MRRTSLGVAVLAAAALVAPSAASAAWNGQTPVDPAGSAGTQLDATVCTSSTNCVAVGRYDDGSGILLPLIERWNGTSWAQQTAAAPPAGHQGTILSGIGCSASNACTAVGSYYDASFNQWALAQRWNGTTWVAQTLPRPAGSLGTDLSGVACTSSTSCIAVGSYTDSSSVSQPFAATWNGTSWTQTAAVPTVAGSTGTGLTSISCSSGTSCMAVGTYLDGTGTPLPYSATWSGSSWTRRTVATPSGASATFLTSVSCTTGTACTTVGYSTTSLGAVFAVAERWNGTTWAQQSLAAPPAGSTGTALLGVSCTSSSHCSAVGYSLSATGVLTPLAEGWNGTTWAVQATPNPDPTNGAAVNGISCTSSTACTSVGYYIDAAFLQHALAQRFT